MKCRNISSTVLLAHSVCPRLWINAKQVTDCSKEVRGKKLISVRHQKLGNFMQPEYLPQDDLCKQTPASAPMLFQKGAKCTILLSLSANITMAVWPALVSGRLVMKSTVTHHHPESGTGSACKSPAGFHWMLCYAGSDHK